MRDNHHGGDGKCWNGDLHTGRRHLTHQQVVHEIQVIGCGRIRAGRLGHQVQHRLNGERRRDRRDCRHGGAAEPAQRCDDQGDQSEDDQVGGVVGAVCGVGDQCAAHSKCRRSTQQRRRCTHPPHRHATLPHLVHSAARRECHRPPVTGLRRSHNNGDTRSSPAATSLGDPGEQSSRPLTSRNGELAVQGIPFGSPVGLVVSRWLSRVVLVRAATTVRTQRRHSISLTPSPRLIWLRAWRSDWW